MGNGSVRMDVLPLPQTNIITGAELPIEKTVTMFPNPVSDNLYIKGIEDNAVITIFDITGNAVFTSVSGVDSNISLNDMSVGFYLLEIKTSKGIVRKPFIIE